MIGPVPAPYTDGPYAPGRLNLLYYPPYTLLYSLRTESIRTYFRTNLLYRVVHQALAP